jgi:hypothetical protein
MIKLGKLLKIPLFHQRNKRPYRDNRNGKAAQKPSDRPLSGVFAW